MSAHRGNQEILILRNGTHDALSPVDSLRREQISKVLEIVSSLGQVGYQFVLQMRELANYLGKPEQRNQLQQDYPELQSVFELLDSANLHQTNILDLLAQIAQVLNLSNVDQLGLTLETQPAAELE